MRKIVPLLLILFLLAGCSHKEPADAGYSFTDSTGTAVTVDKQPGKVAVLLSSLADVWVTAGGTVDITVGDTVERGFADSKAILVDDGAGMTVDLELLLESKPDLVLYSPRIPAQAECADALRTAGIPAAGFTVDSFQDYLTLLKICTDLTGQPDRYSTCGTQLQKQITQLVQIARSKPDKPSFLLVRVSADGSGVRIQTSQDSVAGGILEDLGARNVAQASTDSLEDLLAADPELIFYTAMGNEDACTDYINRLLEDPAWSGLTAVKTGKVFSLPKELFHYKPTVRWVEAYNELSALLYGRH